MNRLSGAMVLALAGLALGAGSGVAQGLADYDYDQLTFRGVGLEGGYIFPSKVENTWTAGGRVDLGFLGPGLRFTGGFNYWSSNVSQSVVSEWEKRLIDLVQPQQPSGSPPIQMDLGTVTWTDYSLTLDAQFMWEVPLGLLTYAGAGLSAHFVDGGGEAIEGTFVNDLLSGVRVGINAHTGLEVPLHQRVRLYGLSRFEVMSDLYYLELRGGLQVFIGSDVPTDQPRRGSGGNR